jgi:hypothetical protein
MKRIVALFMLLGAAALAETPPGWLRIEEQVAAETGKPQITVVHFWAPWCPNSTAEFSKEGWSTFIGSHSAVKFIFVTVRSSDDGKARLATHGLVAQPNLQLLHHPNYVRKGDGSIQNFMDIPLSWVPSTWIFREGRLCYALNYGEVRFPMLQQLIRDTADNWEH